MSVIYTDYLPREIMEMSYYDFSIVCKKVNRKIKDRSMFIDVLQMMFRRIYHVIWSSNSKKRKKEKDLWPIESIDGRKRNKNFSEMVREYEKDLIKKGKLVGGRIR